MPTTTVAEDDEEDATIEEEAEDGIGSRDRSASSDTKTDVEQGGIVAGEGGMPTMPNASREMPPRWSP